MYAFLAVCKNKTKQKKVCYGNEEGATEITLVLLRYSSSWAPRRVTKRQDRSLCPSKVTMRPGGSRYTETQLHSLHRNSAGPSGSFQPKGSVSLVWTLPDVGRVPRPSEALSLWLRERAALGTPHAQARWFSNQPPRARLAP